MAQWPYNLISTHNSSLLHKWVLTHSYRALRNNTNMVLRTGYDTEEWESYFIKASISANSAKSFAAMFARVKLMKEKLQMMNRAMLKELGITAMRESLSILKQAKEPSTQKIYAKAPSAKLLQLHFKMKPPKLATYTSPRLWSSRIWALSRLLSHNRHGLKEGYTPHTTQSTYGGGRCRSHWSNVQNKQQ